MFGINENNRRVVMIASVLGILGAVWFIQYWHQRPPVSPQTASNIQMEVGAAAAEETIKLVGAGDGQIALVVLDVSRGSIPPAEFQQEGFLKAIKKHSHLTLAVTEKIDPDPATVFSDGRFGVPAETFLSLLEKYPHVKAIVSFVGVPKLTNEQIARLPSSRPAVVSVVTMGFAGPNLKDMMQKGVVQAAIVPNPNPRPVTNLRQTAHEWYNLFFLAVTRQNSAVLSD